jgi:hypothetical protein
VGPLISCNAEELLCKGARQWIGFNTSDTERFIFLFRKVNSSSISFSCSGFLYFSWSWLNNLLHLIGLASASTSASSAAYAGVSVEVTLTLVFCLRLSLSASAFGRGLISTRLTSCRFLLKMNHLCWSWLLISSFLFEVWEPESQIYMVFIILKRTISHSRRREILVSKHVRVKSQNPYLM